MANCVGWFCAEGRCWEGQDCLKERVGEGEGEGGCRRKDEKMNGEDKKLLGALVGVVSAVDKSGFGFVFVFFFFFCCCCCFLCGSSYFCFFRERCLSLNEVDKARVSVKTTCVLCKKNSSQKKKEDGYCECRNGDFLVEKKVLLKVSFQQSPSSFPSSSSSSFFSSSSHLTILKMNRYKSSWRQYLADCGKKENKKNTPYRDANGRAIPLTPSLEGNKKKKEEKKEKKRRKKRREERKER